MGRLKILKNTYTAKIIYPIITYLLFIFTVSSLYAASVTLTWDANSETDLAGYKIYWGTATGVYADSADVGDVTTYQINGLTVGQNLFYGGHGVRYLRQ